jgi:hypothetical protein
MVNMILLLFSQIMLRGNDSATSLDVTVDDPDLTEAVVFVAALHRAKNYYVRVAAFNEMGLGPFSEAFPLELESYSQFGDNELVLENSTRYTWLIAMFGSLVFMLILVMSVLVYYRKRNLYNRKTVASNQVII